VGEFLILKYFLKFLLAEILWLYLNIALVLGIPTWQHWFKQ